ncbi:MAG: PAS domain S-box protein, partial [Chloroflexi bacterium]|nr:PAS domain S-box protein [Chloroflexota bacterium]
MQQLANAIQAHLDTLVDQYDERLQTMPGYVNFPAAARRDLERQILGLVAKCLTVGDSQELVHYVRQRAAHWAAAGLEIDWFQAALIVPEEILVPLIESVEASTFLWQALNRSQAAVWQLVAERLQQSEERFRRFSAATEEGLLFHEQGKILDVNPATLALFGYSAVSEIVGRNLLDFIVSESRALVLQKMQLDDVHPYEVECIRKDGSVFPVETSTRAYQHGEKTVRASSVRDITGRKRAEENLRNSEERLRAIYEGTNDAVMLLNEQGFFDCNPRTLEMFGFTTREEFTAVHPANVSPPHQPDGQESLPAAQAHIQAAYRQGHDRFEWIHRRTTGEDFPAEVLLSAVDIGKQRVLQATVRDITERKTLEQSIRDSLERRSRQVEISRQVAQEIAAAPELSDLFQRVVTLTKERFNYYHAQIFRYDPAKEAVVLVEGYGETGHKMLEAGHQLPMGDGVVGKAAETGQ